MKLFILFSLFAAIAADASSDERFLQDGVSFTSVSLPVCQTTICGHNSYCTEPKPGFAVCVSNACRDVVCPDKQVCVGNDLGSSKCIDDPCSTPFALKTCPDKCRVNDFEEAAYCEGKGKIVEPVISLDEPTSTCATFKCPEGTECHDLAGEPSCVARESQHMSCANMLCEEGLRCIDLPEGPRCTEECMGIKVFNDCGSACPLSCDNIGKEVLCIEQCVEGCFCPKGYIENEDKCVKPDSCPTTTVTGCATMRCSSGTACVESPDGAQCVKIDEVSLPLTCANVDCLSGEECVELQNGPVCEPVGTLELKITCANIMCTEGTVCVESPKGPTCEPQPQVEVSEPLTCDNISCSNGEECVQLQNGPVCEPVGTLELKITCANIMCTEGTVCVESPKGPTCEPQPTMEVSEPLTCDNISCSNGEECVQLQNGPVCEPVGTLELEITCANIMCTEGTGCVESPTGAKCVPLCTGGKVFNECGSSCPKTCDTIGKTIPCTSQCVEGCFCPKDTVGFGDECVTPESCPIATELPAGCATVRCTSETVCIESDDGPQCVPMRKGSGVVDDVSLPDELTCASATCETGTTCVETAKGAKCEPDVIEVPLTCDETKCSAGTICIESPNGPACVGGFREWYELAKKNYVGTHRVNRCRKIQDGERSVPNDGDQCSKRPKACFFGNQLCSGLPYPARLCECIDRVWVCDEALACPAP